MVQVVVRNYVENKTEERNLDLTKSCLQFIYKVPFVFRYYHEMNESTVLSGMSPESSKEFIVFVKLVNGEPVDMSTEELDQYLSVHGEFIPDDV
jgi:hypothetical protein